MRTPYDIPTSPRHLNALCGEERGPIRQKAGAARKFRYRFLNPLVQPYVVMRGLASGMSTPRMLARLSK